MMLPTFTAIDVALFQIPNIIAWAIVLRQYWAVEKENHQLRVDILDFAQRCLIQSELLSHQAEASKQQAKPTQEGS